MPSAGHPDWLRPDWNAPRVGALMTTRAGGVSEGPFASMNIRGGLGDDAAAVAQNQAIFAAAIGAKPVWLNQVHGKEVARLTAEQVGTLPTADAKAGQKAGDGKLDLSGLSVKIDLRAEWRQMYVDAWRIVRDWFYDENLHGVDWTALRYRYAALVPFSAPRRSRFSAGRAARRARGGSHLRRAGGRAEGRPRGGRPARL